MYMYICGLVAFHGNNDDAILSCCKSFCHDKARDFMPARDRIGAFTDQNMIS